jgi:HK97 family phage major capsid protein
LGGRAGVESAPNVDWAGHDGGCGSCRGDGTDAGAEGGFAVPPVFRTEIARKLASPLSLASYCNVIETSSNSLSIPPTKPLLSQATLRLNKLSCLVPKRWG